jgi:uridine kinase
VIRASLDGFHNPRELRYARGPLSPQGYYLDSFHYDLLKRDLLDPLGPGGSREFRTAAYDVRADVPLDLPFQRASSQALLLFDAVFLLRPELAACWDWTIFLDISFEESLRRALGRDLPSLGSRQAVEERYRLRYIPGQQLYFQLCHPREAADWVIDHESVEAPRLIKHPPRA